jgi:hypothetical protein
LHKYCQNKAEKTITFLQRRFYNVVFTCAAGLEEFEQKIDRIAENKGEVGDEDSWIAKIYKQFAGEYADVSITYVLRSRIIFYEGRSTAKKKNR